jgi:hypothetical protein
LVFTVMERPQKITFGEMRESGVRGVLVYCSDYRCSRWIRMSADQWLLSASARRRWREQSLRVWAGEGCGGQPAVLILNVNGPPNDSRC